ncbi:MAG: polysaccharide biosynthesis tyrosine autokinase [Planctomycetota bacterium]|nr:polysaccharide biosynthesis tyrosine autokinase [Planctomycetota bacterium]
MRSNPMFTDTSPELSNSQPKFNVATTPPARKDDEQQPHNYRAALLSAIRRGWHIALPLGICLAAASSFLAWKFSTPKHSAAAYLRIDASDRPLLFKTADDAVGQGGDFNLYKSTQQQLLLTPFVLNTALRDPKVSSVEEIAGRDDPITWLRENLKVTFPGNGEIMQISLDTVSPTSCVLIVNGVVDAFMQEVVMSDRNERLKRLDTLEKVFSERTNQVRSKRVELKNLATTLGTSDTSSLTVAQQNALQQFGKMQEKLSEVQFSLMQAEGEIKMAEEIAQRRKEAEAELGVETTSTPESEAYLQVAERTSDVVQLEELIAVAQAKMDGMSKAFGPSHFSVQKVREELEVKKDLLTQRKAEAKMRAKVAADKDQRNQVTRSPVGGLYDLMALTSKTQVLANQEKILKEKVELLADETRQLGRSSIDVELMRSEISGLENVLHTVGDEIERTSVELKTSSRIRILNLATDATMPDSLKQIARTALLGMFGLLVPFGLLVVWDLSRGRVDNVEGASQSLSLPSIGRIPLVSGNPLMRKETEPQFGIEPVEAELDEAIDGLASMILYSSQIDKRQVFMVSSAMPGEGKSTVSCQLAKSLAQAGKSVALVDFDLRRPSIHRYLGLSLDPGLAQSLFGFISFGETLQKTDVENLSVMTAGDWNGNLQERCTAGTVTDLFNYLRGNFDLVVVDSSPVLPVNDARVIGRYTDGVILTLIRDKSRLPASAQACEILRSFGATLLGTVMIGATAYAGSYSGYSAYGTYGKDSRSKRLIAGK